MSILWIIVEVCLIPVILLVILEGVLFGSSVDPDDNGILRTKAQQEKFRQEKLMKRVKNNDSTI